MTHFWPQEVGDRRQPSTTPSGPLWSDLWGLPLRYAAAHPHGS